jgi:hypothetical protein
VIAARRTPGTSLSARSAATALLLGACLALPAAGCTFDESALAITPPPAASDAAAREDRAQDGTASDSGDSGTSGDSRGDGGDAGDGSTACVPGDCDDHNECTDDSCVDGICRNTPKSSGTPCNDGRYCTDPDTCTAAACGGPARECGTGETCLASACGAAWGLCTSATALAVARPAATSVSIDGSLDGWDTSCALVIRSSTDWVDESTFAGAPRIDATQFAATLTVMWSPDALYLACVVTDDIQFNSETGELLWKGDSLQAAFDVGRNRTGPYDSTDDFEYGWAETSSGSAKYRWQAPTNAPAATDVFAIVRTGTTTTYEIALHPADLGLTAFSAGLVMNVSFLVNENDGTGRAGWLEWGAGIGQEKDTLLFRPLLLVP